MPKRLLAYPLGRVSESKVDASFSQTLKPLFVLRELSTVQLVVVAHRIAAQGGGAEEPDGVTSPVDIFAIT